MNDYSNLIPTKNKVLIGDVEPETVTKAGIIVASGISSDTRLGLVRAVASNIDSVKVGDKVYLEWHKGKPCKLCGEPMVVIDEQFIIGVCIE